MAAASSSRGLGVTQTDMDASRLVFVSVKDAKPKRKVAVPIGDGATWDQFCSQVQTKLKLVGIAAVYLASSGEQVTRLDQLQDIDELYVVEGSARGGQASAAGPAAPDAFLQTHPTTYMSRMGVADTEITPAMSSQLEADADEKGKYARRQGGLQRTMKRVFPGLFQGSLPVTTKDASGSGNPLSPAVEQVRRRIRRRRRSCADPRNLLVLFTLISCLGTVLFVYSRTAAHLP
ncbi:hypothetical protein C2E21_4555 [Chlorella sorokiniana]|jgi:hypothetical protein|uniref:Uncharacterized protein n=1 Tax=Chlorella sorokiniana TaxID=3076 RepID=A0A2P6TRV1_CHLSO|nr:hypothetical protein C2E21_4555 [Chlorella sorokiniana]|eukprot:PRW56787.1 hypothetical protein C2E21_4555 [Chlorella sorokiniana]